MLAGRLPGWLLLLVGVTAAGTAEAQTAAAQAQRVSPAAAAAAQTPAAQGQTVNPAVIQTTPQVVRPSVEVFQPPAGRCAPLPALAGQNVDEMLPQLSSRLFRPRVQPEASSEPPRTILREPTTEFIEGRLCYLDIAVSDGSLTYVPNVYRATRVEAEEQLARAGLEMRPLESPSEQPPGTAVNQEPGPKSEVRRGSAVTVWFAAPTLYELPKVIGQEIRAARRALRPFEVRVEPVAGLPPRGEVTGQTPAGPSKQPRGAQVVLEVSDGSLVRVPGVEQQPLDKARAELGRADLQAAAAEREGDLAPGIVASQDPPAGRQVKRGSAVRLAVSTGIEVPQVVGVQVKDARTLLLRFEVREAPVANRATRGEIVTQQPDAGTRVAARSPVELEVSDGSRVIVPELKTKTLAKARAALEQVELVANPEPKEGALESDTVASQDPAAGEEASRGDAVRVVVSTGIDLPSVVGKPIVEATQLLSAFTVTTKDVPGQEPKGQVIKQEPAAGTRVAADAPVGLEVSDGSQVVVPGVEGKALEAARTELEGVGLVIDATPQSDSRPNGTVLRQEPKAGVIASRGDTVRVDVATGGPIPHWVWLLGGLAALGAGVPLVRWIRKMIRPPMSYRARFETEPDSVRIGEVTADGDGLRIAARFEFGESTVRFDGDSS